MLDCAQPIPCAGVVAVAHDSPRARLGLTERVGFKLHFCPRLSGLAARLLRGLGVMLVALLVGGNAQAFASARIVFPSMTQGSCVLLVPESGNAVLFLSARENLPEAQALLAAIDEQRAEVDGFSLAHIVVTDANSTPEGIAFMGAVVAACEARDWAAPVLHTPYPYYPCTGELVDGDWQELEHRLLVPGLVQSLGDATVTCYQVSGLAECAPGGIYTTGPEPSCAVELLVQCGAFRLWLGSSGVQDSEALARICPDVDAYVMDVRRDQSWEGQPLARALAPEVVVLHSADAPRETLLGVAIAMLGVPDSDGTALGLTSFMLVQSLPGAVATESFYPLGSVATEASGSAAVAVGVDDNSYLLQAGTSFLRSFDIGSGPPHILSIRLTGPDKVIPGCVGASIHTASFTYDGVTHYLGLWDWHATMGIDRATSLRLFASSVEPDPTYDDVGKTCLWLRVVPEDIEQDVCLDVHVSEGYGPGAGCTETWRFTFHLTIQEAASESAVP